MVKKTTFLLFFALLLAGLSACSNPDELAEQRYQQATEVEKAGDLDTAEEQYRRIPVVFPGTAAAQMAETQLKRVEQRRSQLQKREHIDLLKRLELALNGYRSLFSHYPRQLAELDRQDYLFGSDYLATAIPGEFEVYLGLSETGNNFQLWSFKELFEEGYQLSSADPAVRPALRSEVKNLLTAGYRPDAGTAHLQAFIAP